MLDTTTIIILSAIGFAVLVFLMGIRIIRPTHRGVLETLGKYAGPREPGFNWVFPIIQRLYTINTTEQMTNIEPQEIITKDNLNATVDCVIYFKVKRDPREVYRVFYEVRDVYSQLDTLARTTARNVIGTMPFKEVNSERNKLNTALQKILTEETKNWGVEVVRVELKDINPPRDVQDTMNKVIKAENEKTAAVDFATAVETQADGKRRAAIQEAQGIAKGKIIVAEAEAQRIKLVNEAANKYFVGNAQKLRQLDVTQASLENNSKIILTEKGINPTLLIGNLPIKSMD